MTHVTHGLRCRFHNLIGLSGNDHHYRQSCESDVG